MRKVIYAINLTADGCCDHTKGVPNEEMMEFYTALLRESELVVWGRKTYELMIPYWPDVAREMSGPKEETDFAEVLTAIPKVVFSRTLQSAEANTTILRDNLRDEFIKLKQAGSGNISIGGVDLPQQLIALGLVDEFHFVVLPRIAGEGRRLVAETPLAQPLDLELVASKPFASGAIDLHYRKP